MFMLFLGIIIGAGVAVLVFNHNQKKAAAVVDAGLVVADAVQTKIEAEIKK